MKKTHLELTDNIVLLRPFLLKDAEEHLAGEDEAQRRWLSGGKSTIETVRNWIQRNLEYWQQDGPIFTFAIVEAKTHALIGMVEANTEDERVEGIQKGEANISYGLYPFARGKGYASRAINLMLGFLQRKGLQAAIIRVDPSDMDFKNWQSCRRVIRGICSSFESLSSKTFRRPLPTLSARDPLNCRPLQLVRLPITGRYPTLPARLYSQMPGFDRQSQWFIPSAAGR